MHGARYALNLSVAPGAGVLQPLTDLSSNTGVTPGAALTELEVIIGIAPIQASRQTHEAVDYSYMNASQIQRGASAVAHASSSADDMNGLVSDGSRRMLAHHGQRQPAQWQQMQTLSPTKLQPPVQQPLAYTASALGAIRSRVQSSSGAAARRLLQQAFDISSPAHAGTSNSTINSASSGSNSHMPSIQTSNFSSSSSSSGSGSTGVSMALPGQPVPNPFMPAYVNGVLAWGSPPKEIKQVMY